MFAVSLHVVARESLHPGRDRCTKHHALNFAHRLILGYAFEYLLNILLETFEKLFKNKF